MNSALETHEPTPAANEVIARTGHVTVEIVTEPGDPSAETLQLSSEAERSEPAPVELFAAEINPPHDHTNIDLDHTKWPNTPFSLQPPQTGKPMKATSPLSSPSHIKPRSRAGELEQQINRKPL